MFHLLELSAPLGCFDRPCSKGSFAATIQSSNRFFMACCVAMCNGSSTRLFRSLGSNIKSYNSSVGLTMPAHPFSTQRALLGPSSRFGRTGCVDRDILSALDGLLLDSRVFDADRGK